MKSSISNISDASYSIVVPYDSHSTKDCGYCEGKLPGLHTTWGMSAKRLTVSDYQYLIDRGWRRSGTYCYKPMNEVTCCPCYPIRCDAPRFQLKRSHKRVLNTVAHFLNTGERQAAGNKDKPPPVLRTDVNMTERLSGEAGCMRSDAMGDEPPLSYAAATDAPSQSEVSVPKALVPQSAGDCFEPSNSSTSAPVSQSVGDCFEPSNSSPATVPSTVLPAGDMCVRKSKARRWTAKVERMRVKAEKEGISFDRLMEDYRQRRQTRLEKNYPKSLEDYLEKEPCKNKAKHYLDVRLVRSCPPSEQFQSTLNDSHEIFQKYQMSVHGDKPDKCDMESFQRFLIKSPLVPDKPTINQTQSSSSDIIPPLGSYHQQYWLDGTRLICVGVVDILPDCLSSVYLFYDPDFAFLHLGIYSALREIGFLRRIWNQIQSDPDRLAISSHYRQFKWYYMGYYIHSCPKMFYKAQYGPSYLACPQTYNWIPVEEAVRLLDQSDSGKYARFSSPTSIDQNSISDEDQSSIDRNIMCVISRGNVQVADDEDDGEDPLSVSLAHLKPYLSSRGLCSIREWTKLVGRRALTGHIRIYFG